VDSTGATDANSSWNTDTECTATGNWVALNAVAYTLETSDKFTWSIDGISNPESGMSRTAGTNWDFDATDSTVFTSYSAWTEKVLLYSYKGTTDLTYTGKSYGNLNAAYLGFNYKYD